MIKTIGYQDNEYKYSIAKYNGRYSITICIDNGVFHTTVDQKPTEDEIKGMIKIYFTLQEK